MVGCSSWHKLCLHILHQISVLRLFAFRIIWELVCCEIKWQWCDSEQTEEIFERSYRCKWDEYCMLRAFYLYSMLFAILFFFQWLESPLGGQGCLSFWGFTITLRHTTLGRTPLDERSVRHRDLYPTQHNTHKTQTSMPPPWDSNPQSQQAKGHTPTP
jgi:hypothetical protein